ncbi:MAG: DinB family protein [Pseudomonadales bacterium]
MITIEYVRLMAAYSHWQNDSIYRAADGLSDHDRRAPRGAFFGSIHATLNHLLWGDQLWLHRLAGTAAPAQPDIPGSITTHADWASLRADRAETDAALLDWSARVTADDLAGDLGWYSGAIQAQVTRPRWVLVVQLFNHGTHHRGQVHAMLTAAGARPEDTDVPFMPQDRYPWARSGG